MEYGEKWRMTDRNGVTGNDNDGRSKECGVDGVMRTRIEGLEPNRMSRNGAQALEMDAAKFYMTWYIFIKFLLDVILQYPPCIYLIYIALGPLAPLPCLDVITFFISY